MAESNGAGARDDGVTLIQASIPGAVAVKVTTAAGKILVVQAHLPRQTHRLRVADALRDSRWPDPD